MGMTIDNLCDSCTNIGCEFQSGIVRTKCAFYMPPHMEPNNCGNYVIMQAPEEGLKDTSSEKELAINEEEYISKADYENRLKADMVAVLEELRLSIEELDYPKDCDYACNGCLYWGDVDNVIQQKINELKQESTTKTDKVDCKHTDCNNCVNHKYCDYEPTTKNDKPLIKCNICKYYTKMEGCLNDRCERFNDTTHPYCYCFWGKEKGADGNDD